MSKLFSRNTLGLAAEFAVASELCRQGIYAQLTLGHQKRTDILVFSDTGGLARIEVKAKQGAEWPNCKGIFRPNEFLVFVDYQHRERNQRPDFFVLSVKDWRRVLKKRVAEIRVKNPKTRIKITKENVSVFPNQVKLNGKPYEGMGIRPSNLKSFRECWPKIEKFIGEPVHPPDDYSRK